MINNIYSNLNTIDNNFEIEVSSKKDKLISESIGESFIESISESISESIINLSEDDTDILAIPENKNEIIIELPVKKKKGRKSKKVKELELGEEKLIEPVRRFPKLSEKIFDVLQINDVEYFYDTDFNLLLDSNVNPVGFKHDKKFIFYSETINDIDKVKKDDEEFNNIIEKIK